MQLLYFITGCPMAAFYCWRNKMDLERPKRTNAPMKPKERKMIYVETKYGDCKIEYSDKKWGSIVSQLSNGMPWIVAGEYLLRADDIVLIKEIAK